MTNNRDNKFGELEKLNALIDVQIDDEEYDKVYNAFQSTLQINRVEVVYKDLSLSSLIEDLFREDVINTHENELDEKWRVALGYKENILPITEADGKSFTIQESNDNDELDQYWSHLFYAKLLRAKIKQKGNDCYTRRLDDVAAYLERHLPQQNSQDEWVTRLTLMYLLELSAASQDWESLGFAERARRVLTDAKHSQRVKKAVEKAPYEFYDLWAHYNIGVAYFHQGYYRKAVLEFNKIIGQVEKERGNTQNQIFFKRNCGFGLLYLPAILFRAEVQLKLQFAYNSLDTLDKRFWKNESINITENERTPHKKIHSMLLEAQAYQQMRRLDRSWGILNGDAHNEVEKKQEGICKLVTNGSHLGQREKCHIPQPEKLKARFPNLGERFLDILIADHLDWLTLKGYDERKDNRQKEYLELRYIVRYGNTKGGNRATAQDYKAAVEKALPYLKKLVSAFSNYFEVVEHHAYNRRGYFQQLAKYLAWLAKAADFKHSDSKFARGQEEEEKKIEKARAEIAGIAKNLYNNNREDLLFEQDRLDKSQRGCRYCQAKGIDLRRIEAEHYTWFTDDMLKFFNSESISSLEGIGEDKKIFVRGLIKLERKGGDDLRIHDLKLRYEFYGEKELLEKLLEDDKNKEERKSRPDRECAEWLCWGELENQAESLDLLKCKRETESNEQDPFGPPPKADVYTNIMKRWDEHFLRHLKSPSTHNTDSGFYFMGLQRWNSASPAKGFSVGGGYLLYHLDGKNTVNMGIAIDPGFDFVRNLFHMGFSLDDIDIVLLSHAHLDHIRDFESIVMLLSELKKRNKQEKRVHVILSLGAYKRLEHIVRDPDFRYFVEPYIIDVDREIDDNYFEKGMPEFSFESVNTTGKYGSSNYTEWVSAMLPPKKYPDSDLWAKIKPTRAYHDDKTRSDSFGFVVELAEDVKEQNENEEQSNLTFGYTGDTKWVYPNMPDPLNGEGESEEQREKRKIEDIAEQYSKCDVLLVHLGSLIKKNDDDDEWSFNQYDQCGINSGYKYRCEKLVRKESHPYLVGILRLLSSLYKSLPEANRTGIPLVLIGEFGEELRGTIRRDFIELLQEIYEKKLAFLPVDVGMNVYLRRKGDERDQSRGNRCACRAWCVQCNHFVNIGDADFELYGADHALYCVCKTCKKATPLNVLQDRLRQLYEVGIELRPYESK